MARSIVVVVGGAVEERGVVDSVTVDSVGRAVDSPVVAVVASVNTMIFGDTVVLSLVTFSFVPSVDDSGWMVVFVSASTIDKI